MATAKCTAEEKFWSRVTKAGPDECWIWIGARAGAYGSFSVNGRTVSAPRFSWELANGVAIPVGLFACHRCDNPPCVNPAHIFIGTHTDNVRDCRDKGRMVSVNKLKTHCPSGHPFSPENTYVRPNGRRACMECNRQTRQRHNRRYCERCEKVMTTPECYICGAPTVKRVASRPPPTPEDR